MQPIVWFGFWFLGIGLVNSAEPQRNLFRTELFPEQLQQQQLQFRQRLLQEQLLALQRRWQVAFTPELREELNQEQNGLLKQLEQTNTGLQDLQILLQLQLRGQGSGSATVSRFEFDLQKPETVIFEEYDSDDDVQKLQRPNFNFQPPPQVEESQNIPQQQEAVNIPVSTNPPTTTTTTTTTTPEPTTTSTTTTTQKPTTPKATPPTLPADDSVNQNVVRQTEPQPRILSQNQPAPVPLQLQCSTAKGEAGTCKPLVKCITFYAELAELRKQTCRLEGNELGVCCPNGRNKPAAVIGPSHGVLHAPPPPAIFVPPITPQQLNAATQVALERIRQRVEFIANIFANNIQVQPGTPAAAHQEFFPTTNFTLNQGAEAQKNVEASVSLLNEFQLTPDQGRFALPQFSVLNTVIADTCPPAGACPNSKYRSADGSCNNLRNERWGRTNTALQRILPPKYDDGVNAPRSLTSVGTSLISAREVSIRFAMEQDLPYDNYTLLVMQWGQFLDHDLTHTPINRGPSGNGISCCRDGNLINVQFRHPDCFPIPLPSNDHIFAPFGERCMEFVRSLPSPRPECNFGPREQMNQVTGYLDGSNIYGSTQDKQRELRFGQGGWLRIQRSKRGSALLPANPSECTDDTEQMSCFAAGDGRVNEQVNLAVLHTIWLREHNRVATILGQLNPSWSDEALFQEARRIVVAEMQHITYNEFLPIILGQEYMERFELEPLDKGFTRLYDEALNGGVTNVFATAAFRFGHSLIQSTLKGMNKFGNVRENMILHKQHFSPFVLYKEDAIDDFVRGLSTQKSQRFDRFFSKEITDKLFKGDLDFGLDLVALNIQRGRDHGLPPYNEWREVCGMPKARSWEDLSTDMDQQSVDTLRQIYGNFDEIDLFIGAVAERPARGALLGPTFTCLVGDQFARLRRGDRYFYEEAGQAGSFSEGQLDQIRRVSLARILCDNSDDIAVMQPLVFLQGSFANTRVPCNTESIPHVDLRFWAQERPQA